MTRDDLASAILMIEQHTGERPNTVTCNWNSREYVRSMALDLGLVLRTDPAIPDGLVYLTVGSLRLDDNGEAARADANDGGRVESLAQTPHRRGIL